MTTQTLTLILAQAQPDADTLLLVCGAIEDDTKVGYFQTKLPAADVTDEVIEAWLDKCRALYAKAEAITAKYDPKVTLVRATFGGVQ